MKFATLMAAPALALLTAPAPAAPAARTETAVLAGGCFWGMESVFEHVKGVTGVVSGYAGGDKGTANYDAVSTEQTNHAEAVRISYDPAKVTYGQLLQIYFTVAHDPTQLNRQSPDTGKSYRSAIFPQSPGQAAAARSFIAQLSAAHIYKQPIVTRIETGNFFPAESYHQGFARAHPMYPYIVINDAPKVARLKARYPAMYKA